MKKPRFYLVCGSSDQSAVVALLHRLGFAVEIFSRLEVAFAAARKSPPEVLLLGGGLLSSAAGVLGQELPRLAQTGCCPVVLGGDEATLPAGCERLALPVGLEPLQQLLSRRLESYSRRHLRVDTKLPGLYARNDVCHFCEIVNLSTGGAFIKTGTPLVAGQESVRLYIPLLGMKTELELQSEIVFQLRPSEENNYQQGAGVRFRIEDETLVRQLETYLTLTVDDDVRTCLAAFPVCSDDSGRTTERKDVARDRRPFPEP